MSAVLLWTKSKHQVKVKKQFWRSHTGHQTKHQTTVTCCLCHLTDHLPYSLPRMQWCRKSQIIWTPKPLLSLAEDSVQCTMSNDGPTTRFGQLRTNHLLCCHTHPRPRAQDQGFSDTVPDYHCPYSSNTVCSAVLPDLRGQGGLDLYRKTLISSQGKQRRSLAHIILVPAELFCTHLSLLSYTRFVYLLTVSQLQLWSIILKARASARYLLPYPKYLEEGLTFSSS